MYRSVGYLSIIMSVFFMFAALFVAFRQILPPPPPMFGHEWTFFMKNPEVFNYLIASLLGAYGIFRFVRSYKMIKNNEL
ncbi:MAG: hypothetical protein NWR72_09345 [Bacteroidia bacterium]|nr:hypothetical protein [Bacteroidia bacterium]